MSIISVIVPVYKVEPYLHRCVDSIMNQTFKDFELILVDDGSPDGCPAICDDYSKQDPRVHVIHQANGGLSAARNTGIDWAFANSDSEWITFVDSDDWIHLEMLERLKKAVDDNHLKIAACCYQKTTGEVVEPKDFDVSISEPEKFYVEQNVVATIACAKLYHKSCFQSIRYPVGRIHEDEFVTYRILFTESKVAILGAPMYHYYVNPSGITGAAWHPKRLDAIQALDEQLCYFKRNHFTSVIHSRVHDYIVILMSQLNQLVSASQISPQEQRKFKKIILRKLRIILWKYRKDLDFKPKDKMWIYETAYPSIIKLYWYGIAFKNKLFKNN